MKRALLAIVLLSCAPKPVVEAPEIPAPNPIVPATEEDGRICEHLARLGCPEAMRGCLSVFSLARTDGVSVPSTCLVNAADVEAVRSCGDKSTLRVDCR